VLHSFQGSPNDGYFPFGAVVLDKQGNVYGTTSGGGTNNAGTVFELTPPATSGGAWPEKLLLMFDGGAGGYSPQSKLVRMLLATSMEPLFPDSATVWSSS
jgi:uncharacterized repeat protein (TIGR03803 family)